MAPRQNTFTRQNARPCGSNPLTGLVWLGLMMLFATPAFADGLKYETDLNGVEARSLKARFERSIPLLGKDRPEFETLGALRRRAETSLKDMRRILRSEGYYNGQVDYELRTTASPPVLVFRITQGPLFRINAYRVEYRDTHANGRPQSLEEAGLNPDGSPRGEDLSRLRTAFLGYLRSNGFPAARLVDHRVEANFDQGTAVAFLVYESGPRGVFGKTEWEGLDRTEVGFLNRFIPWQEGEMFDIVHLNAFRNALINTGLFTTITVEPGPVAADGRVPIRARVTERKPRTLGAGASYSTNIGAGGQVFWEHRNLLGRAERLNIRAEIAQITQSGSVNFRKPFAARRGAWFADLEGGREDNEAFEGLRVTTRLGLQRRFSPWWTASTALEAEYTAIEDTFGERDSTLAALPLRADYSDVNDILDPTRGSRLTLEATPAAGQSDGALFFTRFEATASTHVPIDQNDRFVLAFWSRAGAMIGPVTEEIPANRRFYAGGAGSVRGLGYQLIGPLDENNDPVGGRSVLEGGAEFRFRFLKSFGAVTFIEAGGVFDSGFPDFETDVLAGAGAGLRYYSPIGPLRLDVAAPLDRRTGIDDAFQLYISLGQAF